MPNTLILQDTERYLVPGYVETPSLAAGEAIQVSFWLAEKETGVQAAARQLMAQPLRQRRYATAADWQKNFGAEPKTVQAVRNFANVHGLRLVDCADNARLIVMTVPPERVMELFGVDLKAYAFSADSRVTYRGRVGTIALPANDFPEESLPKNILAVFGLDNRRQARAFFREFTKPPLTADPATPGATASPDATTYPPTAYGFPNAPSGGIGPKSMSALSGSGQNIGVIGFGDNVGVNLFDGKVPLSQITIASPQNITQHDDNFRPETQMDVQILYRCAGSAHFTIFAFDETDQGWISGLHSILQTESIPSVLSISWGWPEKADGSNNLLWTKAAIDAIEDLLAGLALRGVSVVVSSGDVGPIVQYPASSEFVLTCGGTQHPQTPATEAVWADRLGASGGGISAVIHIPDWQARSGIACTGVGVPTKITMRALPDVAAWAFFWTGGEGTSAATPMWAGLLALANEYLQGQSGNENPTKPTVGNINALLYDKETKLWKMFNDIQNGTNSVPGASKYYEASPDWDACTGWGSPHAMEFIEALVGSDSTAPTT